MTTLQKILLASTSTLLLSACGSPNDRSPITGNDNATHNNDSQYDFVGITGTVNGETYNFIGDMRYTYAGSSKRSVQAENLSDHLQSWSLISLPPQVGNYACNDGTEVKLTLNGDSYTSNDCSINVSAVNGEFIEGSFSGTLSGLGPITDGLFLLVYDQAITDLDQDGISDADDNCVYTANPDQADDDNNRQGNACAPE